MILLFVAAAAFSTQHLPLPKGDKEPRSVDLSVKSVEDLTSCVVNKLAESRGYEVSREATAAGSLTLLRFRVMGVAATAASLYVQDLGEERRLVIYATGKSSGAPRAIAARARECV